MASTASSAKKRHDVFISFRGEDTRSNFTSHLHTALCRSKIETHIDYRLQKGDEVWPSLVKAIHDSTLFLIVFSENYASSTWCLNELTEILECSKNQGHFVIPVFYRIDPSRVRKQTGSYGMAFAKHEHNHDHQQVLKWKAALTQAANLTGWDSRDYRHDAKLIGEIVKHVSVKLNSMYQRSYSNDFIGINQQIAHLESLLHNESQDVRFIGIWGMGGTGKTTIAIALFNKLCFAFENFCFLANVGEELEKYGITHLQSKLLYTLLEDEEPHMGRLDGGCAFVRRRLGRKKVLVVLDDVNNSKQLESLVGAHDWFGPGSRVIITSRDKHVFGKNVDYVYQVKPLNFDEAFQLFNLNAFKNNCPDEEFRQLSLKIVNYTKGIPLALIVFGSSLYGKSKEEWKSQLKKLEKRRHTEKQSGLRDSKDIYKLLKYNRGSEVSTGASLDVSKVKGQKLHPKIFAKMPPSEFLDTFSSTFKEHLSDERYLRWHYYPLKSLPYAEFLVGLHMQNKKRRKLWDGVQNLVNLKYINLSDSQHLMELPDFSKALNLEEAFLSGCSNLCEVHPSILSLHKLEVLVLDWCKALTSLRSDIHLRSLRYLSLYKCSALKKFSVTSDNMITLNLVETAINDLPSSICCLFKLESLNLRGCKSLKNLPSNLFDSLRSLRWLWLDDGSNIFELLDNTNIMSSLDRLTINGIAMGRLPASIKHLSSLKFLLFNRYKRLQCLPELPPSIRALSATECSSLETLTSVAIECTRFENCVKLDEYSVKAILAYVMVLINKSLSGLENYNPEYNPASVMYLESRVPKWFKYRTTHAGSITIDLSSAPLYMDWGLLLCFIFSPSQTKEISRILCTGYLRIINHQSVDKHDDDDDIDADDNDIRNVFYQMDATNLTSDHVFLSYTDDFCSILRRNIRESKHMEYSKIFYKINVLLLVLDNDKRKWQKHCEEIKECGVCPTYVLEYQDFIKQMEVKSQATASGMGVGCSYQHKDDDFKGLIFPPHPTTAWKNRTQGFKDIINL